MENCVTEQDQHNQKNAFQNIQEQEDYLQTQRDNKLKTQQYSPRVYKSSQNFNPRSSSPIVYDKTGSIHQRSQSPFMKASNSHYSRPSASSLQKKPTKNQLMYTFGSKTNIKQSPAGWASNSCQSPFFQPKMVGGQKVEDVNNPLTGKQFYNRNIIEQSSPMMMMSMPQIQQYQNYVNGNEQDDQEDFHQMRKQPVQFVKDPNVDRRDYTKNLSQHLFFPGMTDQQFRTSADKIMAKSQRMFRQCYKIRKTRQLKDLYGENDKERNLGVTKQFKPQKMMAHEDFKSDILSAISSRTNLRDRKYNIRKSLLPEFNNQNNNVANNKHDRLISQREEKNYLNKKRTQRRINSQNVSIIKGQQRTQPLTIPAYSRQKVLSHRSKKFRNAAIDIKRQIQCEAQKRKNLEAQIKSLSRTLRS